MRSRNCATKWSNSVNSLGMLPTEDDGRDKVCLVSRPYGKSLILSYTTEKFCPDFSYFFVTQYKKKKNLFHEQIISSKYISSPLASTEVITMKAIY